MEIKKKFNIPNSENIILGKIIKILNILKNF